MIIKTSSYYSVKVERRDREVLVALKAEYEYSAKLNPTEVKRIAYALLLAADGVEP